MVANLAAFGAVLFFVASPAHAARGPAGLRFAERLEGAAWVDRAWQRVTLDARVSIPDMDAWKADPRHRARLEGTVRLGADLVPVEGSLDIMVPDGNDFAMVYEFRSVSAGYDLEFRGEKRFHDDLGFDLAHDFTWLEGAFDLASGPAAAVLRFQADNPRVLLKFLLSFRSINGGWRALRGRGAFFGVLIRAIWREYARRACDSGAAQLTAASTTPASMLM